MEWADVSTKVELMLSNYNETITNKFRNVEKLFNFHDDLIQKYGKTLDTLS